MIYIGTDDGIYRWVHGAPWPVFHSLQGRAVVALSAPGSGLLVAIDQSGRVWETENNGLAWRELDLPVGSDRPVALATGGVPPVIVLATRPLALYRRAVGGSWWNALAELKVPTAPVPPSIRVLAIGPGESPVWYAAVTGAGLWRSDNGGNLWEPCPGLPAEVYAIQTSSQNPEQVVVATQDGCWISSDAGASWEDRSQGLESVRYLRAVEICPDDPNFLLAGAAPTGTAEPSAAPRRGLRFSLYESRDGGGSWSHVKRGFPDVLEYDAIVDICFDPVATDYAIVALASGEMWNTRNGGEWFEPIARQIRAARVLCASG